MTPFGDFSFLRTIEAFVSAAGAGLAPGAFFPTASLRGTAPATLFRREFALPSALGNAPETAPVSTVGVSLFRAIVSLRHFQDTGQSGACTDEGPPGGAGGEINQ